jgi:pyridinium-3,5-bisthiocarboxylic acid mononucleotide nickel chelatase
MANVMYLECFSGAAGDMLRGALVDAGVPLDALTAALGSLGVDHELRRTTVLRAGITATRIEVVSRRQRATAHAHSHAETPHPHEHPHDHGHDEHRSLAQIEHLIGHSALSAAAKARAIALFRRLGEAEAAIHGVPVDTIHFHEVGALDSIIDIVGVVFAMEWLGIEEIVASPLNVGGGTVEIAHGTFPVPAPATARLLAGVPIYSSGPQVELTTPTGALLVSGYAKRYGPAPSMAIRRIGYGAGTRDFPTVPNLVRVLIGDQTEAVADPPSASTVLKIECEIDDMNPQWFSPAMDRIFEAGALDVFLTAVVMKKGRPGTLLTVLAPLDAERAVLDAVFRHTTTIGVRIERVRRETLDRRWVEVATSGGPVRIKIAERDGVVVNAVPEFEDCLRIATATGRAVKDVQAEALAAWLA